MEIPPFYAQEIHKVSAISFPAASTASWTYIWQQ
jgi:hypothetical protein